MDQKLRLFGTVQYPVEDTKGQPSYPFVSIVINNYNYAPYLTNAIESSLEQTYAHVEVVVVDDGSTDESRMIIESFGDRVKPIFKNNGGQASALNAGYLLSRGDLLLFLDSDDRLNRDAVDRVVQSWSASLAKLQYLLEMIDEKGSPIGLNCPTGGLAEGDVRRELLTIGRYSTAPMSGNVFCRRFLTAVMPIPETRWISHADAYLIDTAPFHGHVGAIHETLGQYRVHKNTLSLGSFSVGGALSLQRLRFHMLLGTYQEDLLLECSKSFDFVFRRGTITSTIQHLKLRLASIVLEPKTHPLRGDKAVLIATSLLYRVWTEDRGSIRKKVIASAWSVAMICAPRRALNRMVLYGIAPSMRSPALARFAAVAGPASCAKT